MVNQEINDRYILDLVLNKKGKISSNCMRQSWVESHKEVVQYLTHRFADGRSDCLQEIIFRIKFNIEEKPKCPICGKDLKFISFSQGYQKTCSFTCSCKLEKIGYQINKENIDQEGLDKNRENPMTDEEALYLIGKKRNFRQIINRNPKLKWFMDHRYKDIPDEMFDYNEVLFRLVNGIEERPVCRVCGKPVRFVSNSRGYFLTCSKECCYKDKVRSEKHSKSMAEKTDEEKEKTKKKKRRDLFIKIWKQARVVLF